MSVNSLTIVIVNRNRNFTIVKNTLDAITNQDTTIEKIVVIDYGSTITYQEELIIIVNKYPSIQLILCPTQDQLFHKTRAINIVLHQTNTQYFMVLDMDCIAHPSFIKNAITLAENGNAYNFPYGFLNKQQSKELNSFSTYKPEYIGDLTGTAIFQTKDLLDINGFDEFYHNWGSEDADVFDRLKRNGIDTILYKKDLLLLHQWHPKQYRSTSSAAPYHSVLERINFNYYLTSNLLGNIQVNKNKSWGLAFDSASYVDLHNPELSIDMFSTREEIVSLLASLIEQKYTGVIEIRVMTHPDHHTLKSVLKGFLKKKTPYFLTLEESNFLILEALITYFRNKPYQYIYNTKKRCITFRMNFK